MCVATWIVSFDDECEVVTSHSPSEARRLALSAIRFACLAALRPSPRDEADLKIRLHSGFPELSEEDLIFEETVFAGDTFPNRYDSACRIVRSAEKLDELKADLPFGLTFIPPFRAHANSAGEWTIPAFVESRNKYNRAIDGYIEADRKAGRRWD